MAFVCVCAGDLCHKMMGKTPEMIVKGDLLQQTHLCFY